MPVIEGAYGTVVLALPAGPLAGTDEVQRHAMSGGPPTTLTFRLTFGGFTTAAIPWSNVNATLLASINAALAALASVGAAGIVASAGAAPALTAGIGEIVYTFSGANLGKKAQSLLTVSDVVQTGTVTTVGVFTRTTPGVDATLRGHLGALWDSTGKKLYVNTGAAQAPIWTVAGLQA